MEPLRVGSRASALARWQADHVAALLGAMKDVKAEGTNKVVFTLNQHDNTWPYVLTTLAAPTFAAGEPSAA